MRDIDGVCGAAPPYFRGKRAIENFERNFKMFII